LPPFPPAEDALAVVLRKDAIDGENIDMGRERKNTYVQS
jgi:hypothetical protein